MLLVPSAIPLKSSFKKEVPIAAERVALMWRLFSSNAKARKSNQIPSAVMDILNSAKNTSKCGILTKRELWVREASCTAMTNLGSRKDTPKDKRVQFKPDVAVININKDGHQLSISLAKLNEEPEQATPAKLKSYFRLATLLKESLYRGSEPGNPVLTLHQTAKGASLIQLVIDVEGALCAEDIIVKAVPSGNQVRITAKDFNEKYIFPVKVDPYRIEARLDNAGHLVLQAPVTAMKPASMRALSLLV